MAGHRLTGGLPRPDGRPRPTKAAAQVTNLRARLLDDYAAAQDEPARFGVAQRHLLSVTAALGRRDPAAADELTREATREVLRVAAAMTARLAERPLRRGRAS